MLKIKLHIIFISIVLSMLALSCSNSSQGYTITGKLENVTDSVFYAAFETGDTLYVDTIRVNKKGEFRFSGTVDTLSVISLYFKGSAVSPYILVDKGWTVNVQGDIKEPDLLQVKGGDINDDLTKFKNKNAELLKSRSELYKRKLVASESVDSINVSDYSVELKNVNFELLNIAADYVKKNPTKIASVIIIDNLFKNEESLERLSTALDQLRGVAYDFPLAVQLREYKNTVSKSAIDAYAPAFSIQDVNGKKVTLNDFRGKYVLLTFVSTTCDACNEIQPHAIKEYNMVKKEKMNVEFVSIIKDIENHPVSAEMKKAIKWPLLPEYGGWGSKVFEDYNIKELPYSIIISKDGKVLDRNVTIYNLKNKLEGYPDIKIK